MDIKYVLFDCWDTVIYYRMKETEGNYKAIYSHIIPEDKKRYGYENFKLDVSSLMDEYYATAHYDIRLKYLIAYLMESQGLKMDCTYEQAEASEAQSYNPSLTQGLVPFLKYLASKGLRCSVLSNTIHNPLDTERLIKESFEKENEKCPFERIISSSAYGVKKPDPRFFRLGAHLVGVKPENILFIGDNLYTDIRGSYNAKMHPCFFNWRDRIIPDEIKKENIPYLKFKTYDELHDKLESQKSIYGIR